MTSTTSRTAMRWPASLYHQMGELGWFHDKRVELVRGEIIVIPPTGSRHWVGVSVAADALRVAFTVSEFVVTEQRPVSLSEDSEPEPDIAVIKGQARDFVNHLPANCELAVEVSDSSLAFDRSVRSVLYAESGIPEYWIVDINARRIEVYTRPLADGSTVRYHDHKIFGETDTLCPLAAPSASITVADLLP